MRQVWHTGQDIAIAVLLFLTDSQWKILDRIERHRLQKERTSQHKYSQLYPIIIYAVHSITSSTHSLLISSPPDLPWSISTYIVLNQERIGLLSCSSALVDSFHELLDFSLIQWLRPIASGRWINLHTSKILLMWPHPLPSMIIGTLRHIILYVICVCVYTL